MALIGDIVARLRMDTSDFRRGVRTGRRGATQLSTDLGGVRLSSMGAAKGLIGLAAAYTAGQQLLDAGRKARAFTAEMQRSIAIQNVTATQLADMKATALAVSADVNASADDLAKGFFFLASAGQDAEQQIASLPQVAAFAQAGNFDLATATDLATDAQSALGMTSKDAQRNLMQLTRTTDVLVKANTLANASTQQFSEALTNKSGAAIRAVGKDIEEGVAVLAAFADQGTKGTDAGTQLAIVMRDLQTKALGNASAFRSAGIAVFDAQGEMRNLADIIGDVEGSLAGLSDAEQKTQLLTLGFSDKSVSAIQTLIGTSEKIREYEENLRNAGGTTRDVAENSMTEFDKATNELGASWDAIKIKFGEPILEGVAPRLKNMANNLRDLAGIEGPTDEGPIKVTEKIGQAIESITPSVAGGRLAMQEYTELINEMVAGSDRDLKLLDEVKALNKEFNAGTLTGHEFNVQVHELTRAHRLFKGEFAREVPEIKLPPIDLTQMEKIGTKAEDQRHKLLLLSGRLHELRRGHEAGRVSSHNLAAATRHISEEMDRLTGSATAAAEALEKEIERLGLSEAARKRLELMDKGARLIDAQKVETLHQQLTGEKAILEMREKLAALAMTDDQKQLADLEHAGVSQEQLDQIREFQFQLRQTKKAQDEIARAAQLKEELKSPFKRLLDERRELDRLNAKGLLDESTYAAGIKRIQDEWKTLNGEVKRHQQLLSSAADARSVEAFDRIFKAAARANNVAAKPAKPASKPAKPETPLFQNPLKPQKPQPKPQLPPGITSAADLAMLNDIAPRRFADPVSDTIARKPNEFGQMVMDTPKTGPAPLIRPDVHVDVAAPIVRAAPLDAPVSREPLLPDRPTFTEPSIAPTAQQPLSDPTRETVSAATPELMKKQVKASEAMVAQLETVAAEQRATALAVEKLNSKLEASEL